MRFKHLKRKMINSKAKNLFVFNSCYGACCSYFLDPRGIFYFKRDFILNSMSLKVGKPTCPYIFYHFFTRVLILTIYLNDVY